jgi:hypothetical protein
MAAGRSAHSRRPRLGGVETEPKTCGESPSLDGRPATDMAIVALWESGVPADDPQCSGQPNGAPTRMSGR